MTIFILDYSEAVLTSNFDYVNDLAYCQASNLWLDSEPLWPCLSRSYPMISCSHRCLKNQFLLTLANFCLSDQRGSLGLCCHQTCHLISKSSPISTRHLHAVSWILDATSLAASIRAAASIHLNWWMLPNPPLLPSTTMFLILSLTPLKKIQHISQAPTLFV